MANTAKTLGLDLGRMQEIEDLDSHEMRVYFAALEYVALGWYMVPIQPNSKKLPRANTNINYGSASRRHEIIEKWFNPNRGTYAGYNIGIACGREGGIFAIDIDRHGEKDGMATLKELEVENELLPLSPTSTTPNNGEHRFFQWQENAVQSTGKIGQGIDTRGGTTILCKGHVVAFPSMVDGQMYKWTSGGPLPPIPKWVMEKLGVLWESKESRTGLGNEQVTDDDLERPIGEKQIVSMLNMIDPNNLGYDDWLKLGMSIKSQLDDDQGLAIWDEWSQKGDRYVAGECDTRWKGFSDVGTVRGGTLFYYATQAGWEPDHAEGERSGNKYDELVVRMNKEYAIVAVGGKIRILRERLKGVINEWEMHYDLMDKFTFETLLSNEVIWTAGEKPKPVPIATIWLAHEGRRTYHNGIGLFPLQKAPEGYYNTWHGFSVSPREGDCSLFLEHLENIICDRNKDHYRWLITWLADLVQDPSNPKGCAVVMRGGEGCGKGTFANAIGSLLGPHHRHLIDDSHLTSNFNSHLFDAITIFADEITWGGNKKTAGKLKGMVTERYLIGERKGIDAIQYHNRCHLLIASNSEWVVPASFDSRRWFVCDVPSSKTGDFQYFGAINDELENGGMEALLYFLQNVELGSDEQSLIRSAPVTKGLMKQRVMNAGSDACLRWWSNILISRQFPIPDINGDNKKWPETIEKHALFVAYEMYCEERHKIPDMYIVWAAKVKNDFGLRPSKVRRNGGRINAYKVSSPAILIDKLEKKYPGLAKG